MKVLHLASWYPNRSDPFTGDFIQRHARAASLYDEIIVLYVTRIGNLPGGKKTSAELVTNGNLKEHIIYYQLDKKWPPLDRLLSFFTWRKLWRKLIDDYMNAPDPPKLAHVQVAMRAGIMGVYGNKKYRLPYVLTEHNGIYNDLLPQSFKNRSAWFRRTTRRIFEKAAVFMSVSKTIAQDINREVLHKEYQVVFNTVNTGLFFQPGTVSREKKFRFIHVSNIIPLKNVEGIIRAFMTLSKTSPDAELVIVGGHYAGVHEVARESGLLGRSIFFTGEIPYAEVAIQMQKANALVLFSRTENMPCVVLEALCCGLPVIASRVGGVPEIVNDENGILVPASDETALTNAMNTMIAEYGRFDRKKIAADSKSMFSYEAIGARMHAIYESV